MISFWKRKKQTNTTQESVSRIVQYVRGVTAKHEPFWAFLLMDKACLIAFKKAEKSGLYHLNDYGKILDAGFGMMPPDNVLKVMEQRYNVNMELESQVMRSVAFGDEA